LAYPHFTTSALLFGRVGVFSFVEIVALLSRLFADLLPGGSVYLSTGGSILLSAIGQVNNLFVLFHIFIIHIKSGGKI